MNLVIISKSMKDWRFWLSAIVFITVGLNKTAYFGMTRAYLFWVCLPVFIIFIGLVLYSAINLIVGVTFKLFKKEKFNWVPVFLLFSQAAAFLILLIYPYDNAPMITQEDLQFGKINATMSQTQLLKTLNNRPIRNERLNSDGYQSNTLYFDDGTVVQYCDDTVFFMQVASPQYPTHRGLKVGDGIKTVVKLYGKPDYISHGIWAYDFCEESYYVFFITINKGIVTKITYSESAMSAE